MTPFVPQRYEHVAFALLLSAIQTFIITGISLILTVGLTAELPAIWLRAYLSSWIVAFPGVLVIAPVVRRILRRIVRSADG